MSNTVPPPFPADRRVPADESAEEMPDDDDTVEKDVREAGEVNQNLQG